jgi:hypothetical protein
VSAPSDDVPSNPASECCEECGSELVQVSIQAPLSSIVNVNGGIFIATKDYDYDECYCLDCCDTCAVVPVQSVPASTTNEVEPAPSDDVPSNPAPAPSDVDTDTEEEDTTTDTCVLCDEMIDGYGNNPSPLASNGRCCDNCNFKVVMARIAGL